MKFYVNMACDGQTGLFLNENEKIRKIPLSVAAQVVMVEGAMDGEKAVSNHQPLTKKSNEKTFGLDSHGWTLEITDFAECSCLSNTEQRMIFPFSLHHLFSLSIELF